jgi:chromosome segregation ATPase
LGGNFQGNGMENLNILKRLNSQVDAVLGALQATKDEMAGLKRELGECKALCEQKEQQIRFLQETIAQSDSEMEQLASRIAGVLESASMGDDGSGAHHMGHS